MVIGHIVNHMIPFPVNGCQPTNQPTRHGRGRTLRTHATMRNANTPEPHTLQHATLRETRTKVGEGRGEGRLMGNINVWPVHCRSMGCLRCIRPCPTQVDGLVSMGKEGK